jgi:tetratricopeptide (TPR) repeat protein
LAAYDRALSLKPDLAEAWLGRGNVLDDLLRRDEAFAAYDKALSLRPGLAEAWLGRGNASYDLARYDAALTAYDKALRCINAIEPGFRPTIYTFRNRVSRRRIFTDSFAPPKPQASIRNANVIWRQPRLMALVHCDVGSLNMSGEKPGIE